ncbi:MAG TPA: M15 family metallopeptidase [Nocardioides sp.]
MRLGTRSPASLPPILVALVVVLGLFAAPISAHADEPSPTQAEPSETTEPSDTAEPSETPEPSDTTEPSESADPSTDPDPAPEPAPSEDEPSTPEQKSPTPSADQISTTLALTATAAKAGEKTTLTLTLTDANGSPVPGASVDVVRRAGDGTTPVASVTTGADGTGTATATQYRANSVNTFVANFAGTDTHTASSSDEVTAKLIAWASSISFSMPTYVYDEHSSTLKVTWRTSAGDPVSNGLVQFDRRYGSTWKRMKSVRTNSKGAAQWVTKIRVDSSWRARGVGVSWVKSDTSASRWIDNRPRMTPVKLPSSAPEPTKLPAQPRATGTGADLVIRTIPRSVWNDMTGISWRSGCPVGRWSLRLVRVNYWAFDGYRRRGEIVVHEDAARKVGKAFSSMYARRLPIRSMYRVDRFGYNSRLNGGDDYKSMAADNTSGFNCRTVVNKPGVRSPHSYGGSVDVNPWENPYRSATGYTPNSWWPYRSHSKVAWRNSSHIVVRVMNYNGLRWTYGTGDLHHFDAR